uniref:Uncharacterized protein n=1 Tax=Arundo donax TaxID=35708 RepID=A0A0A8YX73_ARUDO
MSQPSRKPAAACVPARRRRVLCTRGFNPPAPPLIPCEVKWVPRTHIPAAHPTAQPGPADL